MTRKDDILHLLGMSEDSLPVKYLRVPLSIDYIHAADCVPLIFKVLSKIEGWANTLLSTAGRAELIQSTIIPDV